MRVKRLVGIEAEMSGTWRGRNLALLLVVAFLVLGFPSRAHAYIGPGAGFAVGASLLGIFSALLSGILALLTWPIRSTLRTIRRWRVFARSRIKRFVILGLDGMDPALTERFMDAGKLPNLTRLREKGCFKRLGTTIPPISPVAWSSFQTGSNPGKHAIFDFLTRDKRTYQPRLSSVDIRGPGRTIPLGKYRFPLGKADIRLLRRGKAFWKVLGEHGVFSCVIRVPITFPPERFRGLQLSGMCVPDLRGTQGTFSFYTTRAGTGEHTGGERIHVTREGNAIKTELLGAENPLRKDNSVLKCPFIVKVKDQGSAELRINGQKHTLENGLYTEWIRVEFKAAPGIKVRGICKFLLLGTEPEFELYVTPINIDPENPVMPIAHPPAFATYLAKRHGPFATLGLPEDSWALNERILSDDEFIRQSVEADEEREKMFLDLLDKVRRGLCVCVFDGTDRIQHTFWRYSDKDHPIYRERTPEQLGDPIEDVYQRMDRLVGEAVEKCKSKDTVLMVISDHGFAPFRYGVDLNRWLEENGYLKVREDQRDKKYLAGIDWSQTRAFAIGLAGVFLNVRGRELQGIVDPDEEAVRLREEIADKLSKLTDPTSAQAPVKQVYDSTKVYRGPYKGEAPDLIVGYAAGYRASWETAIGQVTDRVFHDNTRAWSGDHCVDRSLVPGVLFCNRPITTEHPRLMDVGPTVLDMFGVKVPRYMDGRALNVTNGET